MSAKWWSQDLEPKQFDYRTHDLESLTKINDFGFGVIILRIHFIWTTEQQNYVRNNAVCPTDSYCNLKESLHLKHCLEKTCKGEMCI